MKKFIIASKSSPLARGVAGGTRRGVAKKFIFAIMCVFGIATAYAENENAATSKEYVDTEFATKQPTIPAEGNNVVMTFDSTATDGIGTKNIYDESASYSSQETALVTAQTANGAVRMALNGELTCQEYSTIDPTDCWLWNLNSVPERTLPAGYTALPYLESTGTQWLDLGQPIGSGENITVKFEYTADVTAVWFGARENTSRSPGFVFDFNTYGSNLFIISNNTLKNTAWGYQFNNMELMTPYILKWYGDPFKTPELSLHDTFKKHGDIDESNYLITPPYNAYLFAYNRGGSVTARKSMRIYYFRVEGKMNLIPARRDSDGEIGMYDTIRNTFLTNQGTGKFISGVYTEHVN